MVETRKSFILGPDGEPIEVSMLTGEIAKPERYGARAMIHYPSQARGLGPEKLASILKGAAIGLANPYLTLAMDMEERYLHYRAQLQTRRLALDGVAVSVSAPKGVDAKCVEFVERLVDDPGFADMIAALQDAIGKGYSVVEPRWEYEAGALRPIEYKHRDPRFFRYDEIGLDDLCLMEDSGLPGLKLVAPYFIVHEPWLAAGPPIRRGLARSAAWAFLVQTFALEDWVAFAEVYGFPFRFGKYHPSATAADKATLLRAVRDIANDAAAIIPEGMAIEFMESKAERGEAVFGALMSYVDRKISMIVVGQTMTAEDGSSLAQAQVHNEVRHDITRADARQTAATVNRGLIRPAVAMNFGPQDVYPLAQLEMPENADLTALGGFLRDAVPLGLKVSQSWTRKMASIPDPQPDDELLGVNTSLNEIRRLRAEKMSKDATTPPGDQDDPQGGQGKQGKARLAALSGCGCPLCGASATLSADDPNHVTAIDETDALIDEALADWREIRDPLLAGLLAAVGKAETFEEALANIETAKIDTGPLIERLAIATAKARGLGDVRD